MALREQAAQVAAGVITREVPAGLVAARNKAGDTRLSGCGSLDHCRDRGVRARVGDTMGELVMEALAPVDQAAFFHSAAFYRNFREVKDFAKFGGLITAAGE